MPADDDFIRFSDLADELGLENDERDGFINGFMEKLGYRPVTSWADPEPEGGKQGFTPFATSKKRETRSVGQRPTGQRRDSQYG